MQKNLGFSLLELTIALLVVGLLVAAGVQTVTNSLAAKAIDDTWSRMDTVKGAMEAYYFEKGYYPWPANPTKPEGDADYGVQDNTLPATAAPTEVVIGAVPFADLRIPIKNSLDGWNNKFTYAVSRSQTDASFPAPMPFTGVISATVPVEAAPGVYNPVEVTDIHWALISHGNLGLGSYTAGGVLIPCPAGPAATAESDNCDGDAHFYMSGSPDADRDRSAAFRSFLNNADYMDDYTMYNNQIFTRYWISPETPGQTNAVNTFGVIGINNDNPGKDFDPSGPSWVPNGVDFDITGTSRANAQGFAPADEKGNLNATKLCAEDGSGCFEAEKIGGTGLQDCVFASGPGNPKAGMSGVGMNSAACINTMQSLSLGAQCASGTFMTGLTAGGDPICN